MKQGTVAYFVVKMAMIAIVPILLFVGWYVVDDPYYVLRNSHRLPDLMNPPQGRTDFNKGLVSLEALKRRVAEGDVPDSFILGASISCYYEVDEWAKYIDTNTTPMHFDSASEGAGSMLRKLDYLHNNGIKVKNVLIILSPFSIEFPLTGDHILSADPPEMAGLPNEIYWYYINFKSFSDIVFLNSYVPAVVSGQYDNHGYNFVFEEQPMVYDPYRNEETIPQWDKEILQQPELFSRTHHLPVEKHLHCSNTHRVDRAREKVFREIAHRLRNIHYHVIVAPTSDLDTLSAADDSLLRSIFGPRRFHNFTASMAREAADNSNWYDRLHYRSTMTRPILRNVYSSSSKN